MKTIKPLLYVVLGFALGVIGTSAFVGHKVRDFMRSEPPAMQRIAYRALYSKLDLSESQKKELEPILVDFAEEFRQVRKEMNPRVKKLINETIEKSRPILNTEQQEQLERRIEKLRKRWKGDVASVEKSDGD